MPEIHNQYSMMKFPEYEHQEYPKFLGTIKGHGDVIAKDAEHEVELKKKHFPEVKEPEPTKPLEPPAPPLKVLEPFSAPPTAPKFSA